MSFTSLLSLALALTACSGGETVIPEPVQAREEEVLARAASASEIGFVRAREHLVESLVGENTLIDVWVSEAAWSEYQFVSPHARGSGAALPADSMLVRTLHDEVGAVQKHTVLWFPYEARTAEDLYFLVADSDWNVLTTDGIRQAGFLASCQACHATRAEDGFVFGAP